MSNDLAILLREHGLLDSWYEYEATRTKDALLEWCQDNNIDLTIEDSK